MKKTLATLLASFVAVALFTSGAFAESKGDKRKSEKQEISSGRQNSVKSTSDETKKDNRDDADAKQDDASGTDEATGTVSDETENQAKEEQKELKEAKKEIGKEAKKEMKEAFKQWKDELKKAIQEARQAATDEEESTVTGATYGPKGYIGLQKALERVRNNPGGKVITQLLEEKYGINAEQPEQAVTALADELDAEGETETAVDLQKELIKAQVKNLELYKKLGKMYEKLGKTGIKAFVNGEEANFEVQPFIKDGTTLVPFRAISEALKANVAWNQDEKSVTVTKNGISVKLLIGDKTAYVNGKEVELEVPGEIVDGSTMVPVRFISEALKADVNWEAESQSVVIYEDNKAENK